MTPEVLSVILGAVMPFFVSLLKQCTWAKEVKFALALALCVIVGTLTSYVGNQLVWSWQLALQDIGIVFMASQVVYKAWFEDTRVDEALTNIGSSR